MQIRTTRKKIKTRMKGKIKFMAKRYQLKTKKTKRGNILLLDGKYICYRNYFGISQANLSHKDMRTGITYGFLNTLKSLLGNFAPVENVVIAWDIPTMGKSIRRKEFPMYKINPNAKEYTEEEKRNKIIFEKEYSELIEAVDQLGFASYGKERYEADDFIALFCNQFKNNHNIIIITRDEDIYQCLDTNVTMYSPDNKKKKTLQWFHKEFGILPNEWYMIKAIGGCFDKKTEILTNRGWIKFPEIKKQDKVYSMNPNTRIATYEKITNVIKYKYKGNMYKIKGKLIDFLVTPDHKFFGATTQAYPTKKSKNIVKFKEIQNIVEYKNFTIPLTSIWIGDKKEIFTLPKIIRKWKTKCEKRGEFTSTREFKKLNIDINIWLAFLGLYLADGYTTKNRNGNIGTIGISAIKQRKIKFFEPILNATPWNWTRYKNGWRTDNIQLASYLHQLGKTKEKYIPREFLNLSTDKLQILFNSLISGDGCISIEKYNAFGNIGTTKRVSYYSSSKKLIDNVQEVAIKLGYATTIRKEGEKEWNIRGKSGHSSINYHLSINKSKNANLLKKKITQIPFNDFVYDVTTEPHHTILVRRNGVVAWSSNCKSDFVPGVPGVGEITAVKYLKGKASKNKTKEIREDYWKNTVQRNIPLVKLPHKSISKTKLKYKQTVVDTDKFIDFCDDLGFASFITNIDKFQSILE